MLFGLLLRPSGTAAQDLAPVHHTGGEQLIVVRALFLNDHVEQRLGRPFLQQLLQPGLVVGLPLAGQRGADYGAQTLQRKPPGGLQTLVEIQRTQQRLQRVGEYRGTLSAA